MTDVERKIVLAHAENNMITDKTAVATNYHRNSIRYHRERMIAKYGLDLDCFYDLVALVNVAKEEELFKKAINYYGAEAQENMCIEECAELIQAINKKHRGLVHNIPEEVADVEITLGYVKLTNCCAHEVERIKERKKKRLAERIGL